MDVILGIDAGFPLPPYFVPEFPRGLHDFFQALVHFGVPQAVGVLDYPVAIGDAGLRAFRGKLQPRQAIHGAAAQGDALVLAHEAESLLGFILPAEAQEALPALQAHFGLSLVRAARLLKKR